MSNVEPRPAVWGMAGVAEPGPVHEVLDGREVLLGDDAVVCRLLPDRERRTIGAWCSVDYFGPREVSGVGMRVPPSPTPRSPRRTGRRSCTARSCG